METRLFQRIVNPLALAGAIVMNALASILPLNGRTTGEISDSFNLVFVPAGYVFSIWGLIYLAALGFAFFQALPGQQSNPRVAATGWWFALSCVANGLWIVFWHYGLYPLTLVAMLTLLVSLIAIYIRVNPSSPGQTAVDAPTRWLVQAPFSLYLGWVSVATIANVSSLLVWLGWDGGGLSPVTWAVIMIGVSAVLSLAMSFRQRDAIFTGVLVWALIGIWVKQAALPAVVTASAVAIAVSLVGLLVSWRINARTGAARAR
jgi:benzodiazapine receptor